MDTAIDLDEKIRGYWLMRTSNLTEREISGMKIITQKQTQLAQVKKPSPRRLLQRNVRKPGMMSEKQETARDRPGGYAEAPNFFIFMETVMMIKLTRFQNQSQIVQSSGTSWMVKNKKL